MQKTQTIVLAVVSCLIALSDALSEVTGTPLPLIHDGVDDVECQKDRFWLKTCGDGACYDRFLCPSFAVDGDCSRPCRGRCETDADCVPLKPNKTCCPATDGVCAGTVRRCRVLRNITCADVDCRPQKCIIYTNTGLPTCISL